MNIVVCVKTVVNNILKSPNNFSEKVSPFINHYDIKAIETAVNLKEKYGGKVTVISMAPFVAKDTLKRTKYLGVDEVILISDSVFAGSDTYATSNILSQAIMKIERYDLIVCGKKTIDGETAQVGGALAASLNLSCISYVEKIDEIKDGKLKVQKKTDYGIIVIEVKLPVVITVEKNICDSRYVSLKELVKHQNYEPKVWSNNELNLKMDCIGLKGSPTQVVSTNKPLYEAKCQFISVSEIVDIVKLAEWREAEK